MAASAGLLTLVGGAFLAERMYFVSERDSAARTAQVAAATAGDLVHVLDAVSNAAQLAALTGTTEARQQLDGLQARYQGAISAAETMLGADGVGALRRASEARARLHSEVSLDVLNRRLAAARALLASPAYREQAETQAAAAAGVARALTDQAARARSAAAQLSAAPLLGLLMGVLALALWVIMRTRRTMARSEAAYLEADDRIRDLAAIDPLTGTMSRGSFREHLQGLCGAAASGGPSVSLIVLDVDDFAAVNATHGFLQGDAALRRIAGRLRAHLRPNEVFGRLGGDEFGVAFTHGDEHGHAVTRAQDLRRVGSAIYDLGEARVDLSLTGGVASLSAGASDADGLLRAALAAKRHAKTHMRGGVSPFHEAVMDAIDDRRAMEAALRAGLSRGEVTPAFQPILELNTGGVVGFEVLARWTHPEQGPIAPSVFIPIAEDFGLIDALMFSVLEQACAAAKAWPDGLTLSLNVAPRQMIEPDFAQRLLAAATRAGWPAARLEVELTENALLADFAAARRTILSLRAIGAGVALDDFGTGYSSLAYLAELPLNKIKIDRAFVRTLHDCEASAKIVASIIGLGRSLGMAVVAEGVEAARDVDALADLGCDFSQGFYHAKPMGAALVAGYLQAHRAHQGQTDHMGLRHSA